MPVDNNKAFAICVQTTYVGTRDEAERAATDKDVIVNG